MLLGFKNAFKYFIDERNKEIFETLVHNDNFYKNHDDIINGIIDKINDTDTAAAKELERSVSYLKYSISKNFYDVGFRDGKAFQEISNPIIEVEE